MMEEEKQQVLLSSEAFQEDQIGSNRSLNKLSSNVEWDKLEVIQDQGRYRFEKALVRDEDQKILTVLRVKKIKGESCSEWERNKGRIKQQFRSLQRDYGEYNCIPIIFDIRETNGDILILMEPLSNSFDTNFRLSSFKLVQWLVGLSDDLKELKLRGIDWQKSSRDILPLKASSFAVAKLNPALFLANCGDSEQLSSEEVITKGVAACLTNLIGKDILCERGRKRVFERMILETIEQALKEEENEVVRISLLKLSENQLKKGKTAKSKGDKKHQDKWNKSEKQFEQEIREKFISPNKQFFDLATEIVTAEEGTNEMIEIIQKYAKINQIKRIKEEINLNQERKVKKLKQLLDEFADVSESVFEPIKFAFSNYAEEKEIPLLCSTLQDYSNRIVSLNLQFAGLSLPPIKRSIIPLFALECLREMRISVSKCFEHKPIFWEGQINGSEMEDAHTSQDSLKEQKLLKKHNEEARILKNKEIDSAINELIQIGGNKQLELLELNLEKNVAFQEDIDITMGFVNAAFPRLQTLEICWSDAMLSQKQFSSICQHLLKFKDKLSRIDLTLWRNSQICDSQVEELASILLQFPRLNSLIIGLLECGISNGIGKIIGNLLSKLPFLQCFEIGLDDDRLSHALIDLGKGFKCQKLLKYVGLSHQDSRLEDDHLTQFSMSLGEMYDLTELHFFLGKNILKGQGVDSFVSALSGCSHRLQILDLGFSQNRLIEGDPLGCLSNFLSKQKKLTTFELCIDNSKLKGDQIALIFDALHRDLPLEVIHLNLEKCSLNSVGFKALTRLFQELTHPHLLTHIRLYVPHNVMGLTEEEQGSLALSLKRFSHLTQLELDFSGCHLYDDFFFYLCESLNQMTELTSYSLVLNTCPLTMPRLKLILLSLVNKKKMEDLSLDIQESEQPQIENFISASQSTALEEQISMPVLKQLNVNLLSCNWSFALIMLLISKISEQNGINGPLPNFTSLNIYVSNQKISEQHLRDFVTILKQTKNLADLTLTLDACGLDETKTGILFSAPLTHLQNFDLSLCDNASINMKVLSSFLRKNRQLKQLGIQMKNIEEPVEFFGHLGDALTNLDLQTFTFYFEQSQITLPKFLREFYTGLASLKNLEKLTFHLHNLDHSQMQIAPFTAGLKSMWQLKFLNIHLPNSNIRSTEVKDLALSLCNKRYLKELQVELFKNEIADKSGVFFAKALTSLVSLEKLDFSLMRCEILPCTSENFCLGIGQLKQLRKLHLYLGENSISPFTLTSLTYSFHVLDNLIDLKLNLQDTSVGDEGIQQLALGLNHLKQLTLLDLNLENTDIQHEALLQLASFFRNTGQHSILQLELSLRNNTTLSEEGFRELMIGIGDLSKLTHLLLLFNHCLLDIITSAHLPHCLRNKPSLKYLHIYFDENLCDSNTAVALGDTFKEHCKKVKRLTICLQQNRIGNEGASHLFESIFDSTELLKITVDIRQNEINSANTVKRIAKAIRKSTKIRSIELLLFEDSEQSDRQIALGLFELAKVKIEMCQQLIALEVRNKDWKENFKQLTTPIAAATVAVMQIISFGNYISKHLHYNYAYTIWDLYLS